MTPNEAVVSPERKELTLGTILAFAAQTFFGAAMGITVAVYLPKFYIDDILLPAGLLAIAVAVSRASDAITDPLMGYISDHTRSRWGRRKPWIAVGVVGNAIVYYLLLNPPREFPIPMMAWFLAFFVISFLFVTMNNIPKTALSVELTLEGSERMLLYGVISLCVGLGLIVGAIMPNVLMGFGYVDPRDRMSALASMYVVGYLLLNALFLWKIKERKEFQGRGHTPFVPGVRRALRSRPFRIMFVSHIITAIPFAIPATLMPFFVQYVMKADKAWTGYLILTYLASGVLFLPIWMKLAGRIGKVRVWLINGTIGVTGGLMWFFIGPGDEKLALLLELYVGSQSAAWIFLGGSMHADVVDYDELYTGKRREAQFSALWAMIPKFALIPGASLPVAILAAAGYVPNAEEQASEVVSTLRVVFALVPAVFNAIGISLMYWYPLTEIVQAKIRIGIDKHRTGEVAHDPILDRDVAPLGGREVDDETSWFLDYFSKGELSRLVRDGPKFLLGQVVVTLLAFAALSVACGTYAFVAVDGVDDKPGVAATLSVVVSGLAFAGVLFQALRVKSAAKMVRTPVSRELVQSHLDWIR